MPTNTKANTRQREGAQKRRPATEPDVMSAIEFLERDHREVEELFEQFEDLNHGAQKLEIVRRICTALTVHTTLEEEIFYPAARAATKDNDLLDEAAVEHASAKNLIAELQAMKLGDDLYDAKVNVLGEQIKHHVREEESELFPDCEAAGMDLDALGVQLAIRRSDLLKQAA